MIYEHEALAYHPQIDFVGFNIQAGEIVSEKIYYKKNNSQASEYGRCPILKRLTEAVPDLRFFSAESYHAQRGVIKYDFQVESPAAWAAAKDFLGKNIESYDPQIVRAAEEIPWLRTQFSTLSFRIYKNERILNTVLYYRRPPEGMARVDCSVSRLVPPMAAAACQTLANYMFGLNAWVRLAAIDFMAPDSYALKVYFETDRPALGASIRSFFSNTENEIACNRVLDYAGQTHLLFRGLAIVMPSDRNDLRFNFYFNQQRPPKPALP